MPCGGGEGRPPVPGCHAGFGSTYRDEAGCAAGAPAPARALPGFNIILSVKLCFLTQIVFCLLCFFNSNPGYAAAVVGRPPAECPTGRRPAGNSQTAVPQCLFALSASVARRLQARCWRRLRAQCQQSRAPWAARARSPQRLRRRASPRPRWTHCRWEGWSADWSACASPTDVPWRKLCGTGSAQLRSAVICVFCSVEQDSVQCTEYLRMVVMPMIVSQRTCLGYALVGSC